MKAFKKIESKLIEKAISFFEKDLDLDRIFTDYHGKKISDSILKSWLARAVKIEDYYFASICKKELDKRGIEFNPIDK